MILEFQISEKSDNSVHVPTQFYFFPPISCEQSKNELEIFSSVVQITQY